MPAIQSHGSLVSLEYGDAIWEWPIPKNASVFESIPRDQVHAPLENPQAALENALQNPLGMEAIGDLVDRNTRVAITLNDWMSGSYYAVPVLLELFRRRGIEERDIRMMVAGGTHAKVTRSQLLVSNMGRWVTNNQPPFPDAFRILPPEIIERWSGRGYDRIERHDAADQESHINIGLTETGQLLEVNRILSETDVLIHVGWGPLPLSPWGGLLGSGIVLGLSSARSIVGHHAPHVVNDPESSHANPFRQLYAKHKVALMEKLEASVSAKLVIIDPFFNTHGKFAGQWWCGGWRAVRDEQLPYALSEFTVPLPRSADIVILDCPKWMFHGATSSPLLAMSHIAITLRGFQPPNPVLRKGGVVICVTPCDGTIDDWYRPADRETLALYRACGRNVDELFDRHAEDFLHRPEYIYKYRFCYGHHPLPAFWLLAAEQYVFDQSSTVIFAGATDSEPLQQMGITRAPDLKSAWEMATAQVGRKNPDVTILPQCSKRLGVIFDVAEP